MSYFRTYCGRTKQEKKDARRIQKARKKHAKKHTSPVITYSREEAEELLKKEKEERKHL